MDVLSLLREYLMNWVIEPVTGQFLGIFDFNGRLGLSFLCMSYSVAYGLFRYRKSRGLTDANAFGQFIGGRRVYLHRSALLDYRYYPLLVPATASRVHVVEEVVEKLSDIICLSAFAGVFWYACGGEISRYTLFA